MTEKKPAPGNDSPKRASHILKVDTKNNVLALDGINLMDCATACSILLSPLQMPMTTISILADVEMEDFVNAELVKTS